MLAWRSNSGPSASCGSRASWRRHVGQVFEPLGGMAHVTAVQAHESGLHLVRFSIASTIERGPHVSSSRPIDVVVFGAGYSGVIAINRLAWSTIRRSWERGLP